MNILYFIDIILSIKKYIKHYFHLRRYTTGAIMTGLNVHVNDLSNKQIDDINYLMESGYFVSKSAMVRVSLLLLVLVVRYTPKFILKSRGDL